MKKVYSGIELNINYFDAAEVIVASGESDFVPEVSTGSNDLPIMPVN